MPNMNDVATALMKGMCIGDIAEHLMRFRGVHTIVRGDAILVDIGRMVGMTYPTDIVMGKVISALQRDPRFTVTKIKDTDRLGRPCMVRAVSLGEPFKTITTHRNWSRIDQIDGERIQPGRYDVLWPNGDVTVETIRVAESTDIGSDQGFQVTLPVVSAFIDVTVRGCPIAIPAAGLKVRRNLATIHTNIDSPTESI